MNIKRAWELTFGVMHLTDHPSGTYAIYRVSETLVKKAQLGGRGPQFFFDCSAAEFTSFMVYYLLYNWINVGQEQGRHCYF